MSIFQVSCELISDASNLYKLSTIFFHCQFLMCNLFLGIFNILFSLFFTQIYAYYYYANCSTLCFWNNFNITVCLEGQLIFIYNHHFQSKSEWTNRAYIFQFKCCILSFSIHLRLLLIYIWTRFRQEKKEWVT